MGVIHLMDSVTRPSAPAIDAISHPGRRAMLRLVLDRELASYEVTIAAPIQVVWEHLTTAEGLVRWVGPEASADPAPGGILRWTHQNGASVVGRFVELVPYRRLVFTYGWEGGRMGVPPESTTVEVDLVEEDGATTLRLVHHGLPPGTVQDHQQGWAHFLGALRAALSPE